MTLQITPETTNQEIFDYVANHLRTQGKQAIDPVSKKCRYRTSEGLSCAVGCLIPDEKYDPKIEGQSPSGLFDQYSQVDPLFEEIGNYLGAMGHKEGRVRRRLLYSLQCVHDLSLCWNSAGFAERGETDLARIASEYGLTYTAPSGALETA